MIKILIVIVLIQLFVIIYFIIRSKQINTLKDNKKKQTKLFSPKEVSNFYNETTPYFLKTYGEVFQSLRTKNIDDYLTYTATSAKLCDGQIIFDAGCGVGGPAIFFANKFDIKVHGCTISEVQTNTAQELIQKNNLENKVQIFCHDYHKLHEKFNLNYYDRVLFLESLGHSDDVYSALKSAREILKPGGILYIKDLFKCEPLDTNDEKLLNKFIDDVNERYKFNMYDLYEVLKALRRLGFIILNVKTPEILPSDFENFQSAGKLQTDYSVINMEDYNQFIQPADYLELILLKPPFNIHENKEVYYINKLNNIEECKDSEKSL